MTAGFMPRIANRPHDLRVVHRGVPGPEKRGGQIVLGKKLQQPRSPVPGSLISVSIAADVGLHVDAQDDFEWFAVHNNLKRLREMRAIKSGAAFLTGQLRSFGHGLVVG